MMNFNWDEFKCGELVVHCDTKEKAIDFLTMCDKNEIGWNSGYKSTDYDKWDIHEADTGYCCYSFKSSLEYSPISFYKEKGKQIIKWEIDRMKTYKIQDLYKEEFVDKNFKDVNSSEIFTVIKGIEDRLYVEDSYGSLIEEHHDMIDILNMTFELIEEETKQTNSLNKNSKIYIAGSLFNEAEIAQRLKEEKLLREMGFENIFNPINSPQNNKEKLPTCLDIFYGDTDYILDSDIVTVDITNPSDSGVNCELGIIWMCNYLHKLKEQGMTLEQIIEMIPKKQLIAVNSDIRKPTAHCYKGDEIPVGFNQFQVGLIKDIGVIKDNFKEVLEELKGGK